VQLIPSQSEYFGVVYQLPSASLNRLILLATPFNYDNQQFGISLLNLVALLEQSAVGQELIKYTFGILNT
jgi:hypothetical protein